ncbi:immunity 52 family protein [Burkholderia vietnamiensis]|uniref:immunity 52 family protein n=1 Tax=Burkholderia vietnamiensis TaxID=60552 RepID=UPI00264F7318|nr:immunity 52 family protein [Burkholderia vietnamiensis]MDN7665633.1 immunity 52 family protein [Burkholderia vietnamiensis]
MSDQNYDVLDVWLTLRFRFKEPALPPRNRQCADVYKFSEILKSVGFNPSQWYVMGDSAFPAFTSNGPSDSLIESLSDEPGQSSSSTHIWNGLEGKGGAGFGADWDLKWLSKFEFRGDGFDCLRRYDLVAELVTGALGIWPGQLVQVGPYAYSDQKVFPDRPGVGWMLYLPHVMTPAQVPEARALIPVVRDGQQYGTIIVSVTDGPFDVSNRAHVKVANDIEIRLADQDLLPRYVDL